MKLKNILLSFDKLRSFLFPNILVIYTYIQIVFLLIYFQINTHATHFSQIDINSEKMFDFGIVFSSFLISIFMICLCIIMTFIEYLLREKINFKIININNYPKLFNIIHASLFYFGLIIILSFVLNLIFRIL